MADSIIANLPFHSISFRFPFRLRRRSVSFLLKIQSGRPPKNTLRAPAPPKYSGHEGPENDDD
jgi:hypothetical protein